MRVCMCVNRPAPPPSSITAPLPPLPWLLLQVADFEWPSKRAPDLERLVDLCRSFDSWLRADNKNVIVIHCNVSHCLLQHTAVLHSCLPPTPPPPPVRMGVCPQAVWLPRTSSLCSSSPLPKLPTSSSVASGALTADPSSHHPHTSGDDPCGALLPTPSTPPLPSPPRPTPSFLCSCIAGI